RRRGNCDMTEPRGRGAATIRDRGRFAMSTLPPLRRAVDRCGAIMAAAVLLILLAAAPLWAAEDEPYSVTVSVDATSDTIGKARDQARNDGQRRAFATLAERLSGSNPGAKLAKLDDNAFADLVGSFEVANERMSAVRYIADVTYHFRPAEVQRVLQKAGIALGSPGASPLAGPAGGSDPGKTLVVTRAYQSGAGAVLWDAPSPGRDAWVQPPPSTGSGGPHFAAPLGDAGDPGAIDAAKARAGAPPPLAAIPRRNGGDEA